MKFELTESEVREFINIYARYKVISDNIEEKCDYEPMKIMKKDDVYDYGYANGYTMAFESLFYALGISINSNVVNDAIEKEIKKMED